MHLSMSGWLHQTRQPSLGYILIRKIIMKTDDDSELRAELAAYAAKESQWNAELMRTNAELD